MMKLGDMFNIDLTQMSTSTQGGPSGYSPPNLSGETIAYTVGISMTEGKWERVKPIVFSFYESAYVFLHNLSRYEVRGFIRETEQKSTQFNKWKVISVRVVVRFENKAEAEDFIKELREVCRYQMIS